MEIQLNTLKALEFLLVQEYISEFNVIDALSTYRDYTDFYSWLLRKKIISQEEHDRIQSVLEQNRI